MTENNRINSEFESKIESEIFALVKSITNLNTKYQKGIVNENFFRKTIKTAMNNLLKINLSLKERNLQMSDLIKKMDIAQEYNSVLNMINRLSSLHFPDNETITHKRTFLELPAITSEITTSFITLMDALTLDGLGKKDIIFNLFDELNHNLSKFPGLNEVLFKVKELQKNSINQLDLIMSDAKLKDKLIDKLYEIFREFQNKLNLKT
ncbi:MAG: hypothetical protein JSV62_05620 [Promethearchaeota archaeon]|nr:MAG: hypothetical protein JSV62_05620 [Candidatus Lokiarchaeota archaeon]